MEQKSNSLWNWFKGSKNDGSNEDNRYSASIEMEKQIGEQIYNALQGSVVEEVLRKTKTSNHYCPIKIGECSLKLLKYSYLRGFFGRNDLKFISVH